MRVSPTRLVVGALTVGGMSLGLLGSPAGASTSPKQTVKNAIAATESATSLKIFGSVTQGTQTISLNVSASTLGVGQGTVGIGTGVATVRLVGGTIYFMGSTKFWTQQSGKSAAQLFAGKWVKTAATTTNGKSLAQFLNSANFMKQLFSSNLNNSKFTKAGTGKVAGKSAVVISGVDSKNKTSGRIYVAKSGTPYILKIAIDGKGGIGSLTFSNFNQPITPAVPSGAIDLDTLGTQSSG